MFCDSKTGDAQRETSPVEGSQNILLSSVNKGFTIISSVKVNHSIKQDKNCFY